MHKKEIRLYQISHKNGVIGSRNINWSQNGCLIQVIKRYGARWSAMSGRFQIPVQSIQNLIDDLIKNHDEICIKDANISNIRTVLYESQQIDARKITYSLYKNHGRFLIYDPLFVHRFEYTRKFLQKQPYLKVLLICFANSLSQWSSFVQQRITKQWTPVDYRILFERNNPLTKPTLANHDFYFITYQQLNQTKMSRDVADKFDLILCDDSERWMNDLIDPLVNKSRINQVYRILKNYNLPNKRMILITATLPLDPTQIYNACSILMPMQFGIKVSFEDHKINFINANPKSKDCNDASWMIKRYVQDNKFARELLYVLENSVLVNLSNPNHTKFKNIIKNASINQIRIHYDPQVEIIALVDRLNQKYKKVNKEEINGRIQDRRCEDAFISWQLGKTEQSKYLKQLRETMVIDKLPALTKHLYHLTKQLGQRVVLVLQTMATFEKLLRFLNEQTVPYILYSINVEDIRKGNMSYIKFNVAGSNTYKLCILVRDRLLMQYKKCVNQFQKELEYEQDREAQMQLGMQQGHFSHLAIINRKKINKECFNFDHIRQYLPKINSARHLIIFDSYWYDFQTRKEDIVSSILKAKLPCYQQATTQNTQNTSFVLSERKIDYVRHYFINNKSIQTSIIKRYNNNLNDYFGQENQITPSKNNKNNQEMTLQAFTNELFSKISRGYPKQNVKSEVHDIDDEFDQWEYQLLKQKQKKEAGKLSKISQNQQQQPQYMTQTKNTPHFTAVTALIADSDMQQDIQEEEQPNKKVIEYERDNMMQVLQQKQDNLDEIGWLKDDGQLQSDNESEGSIDLTKYLAKPRINQQISDEHIKKVKQLQEIQKKQQINKEIDNQLDVTIRKDQKLVIDEPPELIQIQDDSNKAPINIYKNHDPNSSDCNFQYVNKTKFYNFPPNYNEQPRDSKGHKIRSKAVAGLNLYGPKAKKRIVPPKTMNLSINLIPNKSRLQVS